MTVRARLRCQLLQAWTHAIDRDYRAQRINCERSLQASFWSHLNVILPAATRRMFIEPRLVIRGGGVTRQRFPDIVICNTRNVIAVVELKYLPRTSPRHGKDVETLRLISRNRGSVTVANTRHRGPAEDARQYGLGKDVLFVWAGVHRAARGAVMAEDQPLLCGNAPELERCFMQLHAVTCPDGPPRVFALRH